MDEPATAFSLSVVKEGIEVLEKLGVLERLRLKLVSDSKQAARHLYVALSELAVGYTALHNEIVAFGLLDVDEPMLESKTKLTRLRDGRLATEVSAVKGSCARIMNIYYHFLTGWFSHALNEEEAREIQSVFTQLREVDGKFINAAEELSKLAQRFANEVLALLRDNRADEAKVRIRELEKALDPHREELSSKMATLWDLQAKFTQHARTI